MEVAVSLFVLIDMSLYNFLLFRNTWMEYILSLGQLRIISIYICLKERSNSTLYVFTARPCFATSHGRCFYSIGHRLELLHVAIFLLTSISVLSSRSLRPPSSLSTCAPLKDCMHITSAFKSQMDVY